MKDNSEEKNWSVYLLECSDGTYYTGCTNNLVRRVKTHNAGRGAKYTKIRRPVTIIASKCGFSHGEALREEFRIKQLSRSNKIKAFDCK